MEPKRALLVVVFVYSVRWLVPAEVQYRNTKQINTPPVHLHQPSSNGSLVTIEDSIFKGSELFNNGNGSVVSLARGSAEAKSLTGLLKTVVRQELHDCSLVLAYEHNNIFSAVVQDILTSLPNMKQVVNVNSARDLERVNWVSGGCGGYIILLDNPEPLLTLANTRIQSWNYQGRYVLVCRTMEQLIAFTSSNIGKKTEHILGVIKGDREGEWRVYMNVLYWGEGVRSVTTWRHHKFTTQLDLFPDKLSDLRGAALKVCTFEIAPSIMYYKARNGSLLFRYGEDIALVKTLAQVLNFKAKFAEPSDGELWGEKVNGVWQGMNGELERGEVDIGVANFFISIAYVDNLDYSAPYKSERTCFMARTEPPLPRWQALAFPFHPWTWLAILVGLIVSGPIFFLLTTATHGDANLSNSWFYTFGLHFREPQSGIPNVDTIRVFVIFLWVYTMILTVAYSTNLTAFLLVQKPPTSIQTIREVYDSGMEVAAMGYIFNYSMAASTDPYLRGLTKKFRQYPTEDKLFARALTGKAIVLQNRGLLEYHATFLVTPLGRPKLRILKECFAPYSIAMTLQKHSPLKRKFDEVIGWMQQSGLIDHSFKQSLRMAASTKENGDGGSDGGGVKEGVPELTINDGPTILEPLNLDHLQGIFMLTGLGWVMGFLGFIIEMVTVYKG